MTKDYDKPHYIDIKRNDNLDSKTIDNSIEAIKEILINESFGVLATKSEDECYTSLISFAISDDLTTMVFATPRETKKFEMIKQNKDVSILVDNRSDNKGSINDIAAITSLGQAEILEDREDIKKYSKLLLDKHSYLDDFIGADSTALITIKVSIYDYVTSFQEVIRWNPK